MTNDSGCVDLCFLGRLPFYLYRLLGLFSGMRLWMGWSRDERMKYDKSQLLFNCVIFFGVVMTFREAVIVA